MIVAAASESFEFRFPQRERTLSPRTPARVKAFVVPLNLENGAAFPHRTASLIPPVPRSSAAEDFWADLGKLPPFEKVSRKKKALVGTVAFLAVALGVAADFWDEIMNLL